MNDLLATVIALQTTLGANVNGVFGSLAARLNQVFPGGGAVPGIATFTQATHVAIAGTQHNVGQAALLFRLYDAQIPANAMAAGSFTLAVQDTSYDVTLDFTVPVSGSLALGATSPLYIATFTNATTVNVLGTTHQLNTSDVLFQVYDAQSPRHAMGPGSLTVHQTTHNVILTFGTPQSGILVLGGGGPTYAVNFTLTTPPYTVSIPGSVHQLGTSALLWQVYDNATPRAALGDPGCTVHPNTYDVLFTFVAPISGRIVLMPATTLTGREFDIRDAGVINQSAVRMRSASGTLHLQSGIGEQITFEDKLGAAVMRLDTVNKRVGIGTTAPAHQLELSTTDAVKLGGGPWLAPSDDALKEDATAFTAGLEVVTQLEPIRYRYKDVVGLPSTSETFIGLSAQAAQAVAPYLVRPYVGRLHPDAAPTSLLALDSGPLVYLLLNAVKALHALLNDERAMVQRLQQQVTLLASRFVEETDGKEAQP